MSTQNFKILGHNDETRSRRFKVLQLYLRNATPPEIAHTLGLKIKRVYDDINFLRTIQLNDLPLEIIKDMGANFFEMKVRELQARVSEESREEKKDRAYIINLEKLILSHKIESLKVQGAYNDQDNASPGPVQIFFTEVGPDFGKDTAEQKTGRKKGQAGGRADGEQKEGEDDPGEAAQDPEKEYPLY